jgi:Spy/CpxP family protein refolding chaperone
LRKILLAVFATTLGVWGQASSEKPEIAIFPPPVQAFEELKQHLGLSDGQLQQLRTLLEEKSRVDQDRYRLINEKNTELNNLLRSGSRDANRIGQLTIDIHVLGTQPPPPNDQWRQRALAVLTAEQRTKLGPLDQAMKLATTAYQANTLNLIDPPPPGRPIILARPSLPADGTPVPLPQPLP